MQVIKDLLVFSLLFLCLSKAIYAQPSAEKSQFFKMKQESIVTISAFTAKGNQVRLKQALYEGLDAGLTISEIKEVIVQLYAYTGFPRSLNALQTFMEVLKEREHKGIKDPAGKEPLPLPANRNRLQFGTDMQTKLVGQPVKGALYEFSPAIDSFLKEHLFGDIFGRDNLDWKTRELATISALAALGGVENQLRSHFGVGMYNGLTEDDLTKLVSVIQSKVDANDGAMANKVLLSVLQKNNTRNDDMNKEEELVKNEIFPKGEKAPQENFTGTAWIKILVPKDETGTYSIGNVVFEPGCRNNWHKHPSGQTLIVADGKGWYQEKGKAARTISKGDVVVIPSNVGHWHGAAKNSSLTHLAVTNMKGGSVEWLQKVTD